MSDLPTAFHNPPPMEPPRSVEGPAWCLFRSDRRDLAVPLEMVKEIVSVEGLVPFPLGPPRLLGLFSLRREVVPVLKLYETSDDRTSPNELDAERHVVMITRAGQGIWGVRIDREGILVAEGSPVKPALDRILGNSPPLPGRLERAGTSYDIVDLEAVWRSLIDLSAYRRGSRAPGGICSRQRQLV